ncbi:MAG: GntR family transcriptional regulator [Acholeplasmataceae bacterium]
MDYIIIDKTSKIPLYIQISDSIRHHINLGVLKHGMQLPTEKSICSIYEVSNIVVKKAYDDLVKKDLVTRIRGKGTFVNTTKPYVIDLSKGIIGITTFLMQSKRTVLSFEKVNHHNANKLLNIDDNEFVYIAKIISSINDQALFYEVLLLPDKFFPNVQKVDIKHLSVFDLIVKKYKLDPKSLSQSYRAININNDFALLLDSIKGKPAHYLRSVVQNDKGESMAFILSYGLSELIEFEVSYS